MTAWAAAGSGASPPRDAARGWDTPIQLAQLPPGFSDDEGEGGEDTLGVEEDEPLTNPDTTQTAPSVAPPDTARSTPSPADTTGTPAPTGVIAPADSAATPTFLPVAPDSAAAAAARRAAAADSGIGDTLFMAKPKAQGPKQTPAAQPPPKKPRSGILGVHPIAILVGLAALHYFVTRSTGD